MGNVTLTHTGPRLTFAINLDFPLDPDWALVGPKADVHLQVCGLRSGAEVIIRDVIVMLFIPICLFVCFLFF